MLKSFLSRVIVLLGLALLTNVALEVYFNTVRPLIIILSFPISIFFVILLFWFYENSEEVIEFFNVFNRSEGFLEYIHRAESNIEERGVLNFQRVAIFLLLVRGLVEAEKVLLHSDYMLSLTNMLINLSYLVYVYLIFYPMPENVDLDSQQTRLNQFSFENQREKDM